MVTAATHRGAAEAGIIKAGVMRPVPLRRDYICNASSKPAKRRRNARLVNQQIADPRPADIERRRRPAAIIDG